MQALEKDERAKVKELLGLHPIKDAVTPLKFWTLKEDIEKGVPKDFANCAFSLSVQRITGRHGGIATFKKSCYVPVDKNGDGKFIIERYTVRKKMHKAINDFDKLGTFAPGEYTLYPPSKHEQLKQKRKTNKVQRQKRKAAGKHTAKRKPAKELSFLDARNGTGRANLVVKSLLTESVRESSPLAAQPM